MCMVTHNTYGYTITVVWFIVLTLLIVFCHNYIPTWSKSAVFFRQKLYPRCYIIKLLSWTIWKHVWLRICTYGYFHVSNSHYRHGNTPNTSWGAWYALYALYLYFYHNTYGYAISTTTWFWLSLSDLVVSSLAIFVNFVLLNEHNTGGHFAYILIETVLDFFFSFWQFCIWNMYGYAITTQLFPCYIWQVEYIWKWCEKNKWDVLGYSNSWRLILVNIFAKNNLKIIFGAIFPIFSQIMIRKHKLLASKIYNIQYRLVKVGFHL